MLRNIEGEYVDASKIETTDLNSIFHDIMLIVYFFQKYELIGPKFRVWLSGKNLSFEQWRMSTLQYLLEEGGWQNFTNAFLRGGWRNRQKSYNCEKLCTSKTTAYHYFILDTKGSILVEYKRF